MNSIKEGNETVINFKDEYTDAPGGRYMSEGKFSGEHFREVLLQTRYLQAVNNNELLIINMDGCYGFPAIFLSESFGGLAKQLNNPLIMDNIEIIYSDEPCMRDKICKYIEEYLKK